MIPVSLGVAMAVVAVAVLIELPTKRIPNWLCLSGIIVGLVLAWSHADLLHHVVGLLVTGVLAIVLYAVKWVAGGAAKLLMAVGAMAGLAGGLTATAALVIAYGGLWVSCRILPPPELDPESRLQPWGDVWPSSPIVFAGLIVWLALSGFQGS